MKNIRLSFITLFIGLTLLWLLAEDFSLQGHGFWPLRTTMVHYSGILAMGAMSVAMLLAMRPVRIERFFDGLDKTYRLHKWLGISALVLGILHWGWARIPKWLVGWGWLERPARKGAAQSADTFYGYLHSLRGFAEGIGERQRHAVLLHQRTGSTVHREDSPARRPSPGATARAGHATGWSSDAGAHATTGAAVETLRSLVLRPGGFRARPARRPAGAWPAARGFPPGAVQHALAHGQRNRGWRTMPRPSI